MKNFGWLERKQNRAGGFNLIEVIIVVTIAGVLAAAAAPSFRGFIATQRVKTASFDLIAALTQTRSEAVKRNANVSMTAAGGGWNNGWTIASGATTLGAKSPYTGLTIFACVLGVDCTSTTITTITYRGDGRLGTAAPNFKVNASAFSVTPRYICLSLSGQPSSKTGSCS